MKAIHNRSAALALGMALGMAALPAAAETCDSNEGFTLLLHGGFLDSEEEVGPPQESIAALEDSGILNAGKGSIVNTAGFTESDASLMDGRSGRSGAVAAMQRLKNPIKASRLVMDETEHVLFAGTNGEQTLAGLGAELVKDPASYFQKYLSPPKPPTEEPTKPKHGTVGAVALDRCGNLAAGTSTGGWPGKMPGWPPARQPVAGQAKCREEWATAPSSAPAPTPTTSMLCQQRASANTSSSGRLPVTLPCVPNTWARL